MFEKSRSIYLKPQRAYTDACLPMMKRIKFCSEGGFLVCENDYKNFTVRRIAPEGEELDSWTVSVSNGSISDYLYIGGVFYISFVNIAGEYDETYTVYKSVGDEMVRVFSAPRESYQHDMDYFSLFEYRGECRLLMIRHNRIHLYSISGQVREINVLEGQKWYISNGYPVCALGRDWEIYEPSLELITSFKFEEEADWLDVEVSRDGQTVVMATNNSATEIGGLFIYDRQKDDFEIHYQRYGFYDAALCSGRIWSTVGSIYSGIGGLMIFDKTASLKFAHLRDETEGDTLRAYHPAPLVYQSASIEEISDNKVLILDCDKAVITDITCRPLQELKHPGYDCFILSESAKTAAVLNLENRLLGGRPEIEYNASIDIYSWDSMSKKARVVDLTSFRK